MTSWCPTSSDYPGVRLWLEKALIASAQRGLANEALDIPPDFAQWIGHLFYLNSCLSAGTLTPANLLRDEAESLRLLDEVTRALQEKLRRCPACGLFQEATVACRACGKSMSQPHQGGAS